MADIFNLTDTWNDAGVTFNAIKMNVTDTASADASLLLDLQVAGASKASITKAGATTLAGTLASGALTVTGAATVVSGSGLTVRNAATDGFNFTQFNTNSWRLDGLSAASVLEIGGNTTTVTITGAVTGLSSIKSSHPTAGVGYATGAGGAVTQLTSRTTGVTINKASGAITLFSEAGTTAYTSFTVTNSAVEAADTIEVSVKSSTNKYLAFVTVVAAGSFEITFNTTGGAAVDAPVFNFAVIKAVAA